MAKNKLVGTPNPLPPSRAQVHSSSAETHMSSQCLLYIPAAQTCGHHTRCTRRSCRRPSHPLSPTPPLHAQVTCKPTHPCPPSPPSPLRPPPHPTPSCALRTNSCCRQPSNHLSVPSTDAPQSTHHPIRWLPPADGTPQGWKSRQFC
ncbi:hypothetical protein INR49_014803 [Caranx melampygus]|nr:hypothetical protein INR49_014803 [Caranx melampygus]